MMTPTSLGSLAFDVALDVVIASFDTSTEAAEIGRLKRGRAHSAGGATRAVGGVKWCVAEIGS